MQDARPPIDSAWNLVFEAAPGRVEALLAELAWRDVTVVARADPLIYAYGAQQPAAWAQNTWLDPHVLAIESIGDAARQLRAKQRNWWSVPTTAYRRTALVAERLPPVRAAPLEFPAAPPTAPLGAWTLVDRHCLVASASASSHFPRGRPQFVEDRAGPPNRAYLKLWEALTLTRDWPQPGQTVLDLGAAPGGWSWVAATLGADVTAVDRAGLAMAVASNPRVESRRSDAFKVGVSDVDAPDWILCDVAGYPERIVALAQYWAEVMPMASLIMTLKFRRNADPTVLDALANIPHARLCHLGANKNELTLFRLPEGGPPEAAPAAKSAANNASLQR